MRDNQSISRGWLGTLVWIYESHFHANKTAHRERRLPVEYLNETLFWAYLLPKLTERSHSSNSDGNTLDELL